MDIHWGTALLCYTSWKYLHKNQQAMISRVSTGIPGYGLRTEMIRKFFPFPLWKRFRKTGIPGRFPELFFFP